MSDPRLTPATARVAHESLRGTVEAPRYTAGTPARVLAPLADLRARPDGPRERQLLRGAALLEIDREGDWVFVWALFETYCGWVEAAALGPEIAPSHRITAPGSQLYAEASFKSRDLAALSMGTLLAVTETQGAFGQVSGGWVPLQHLTPVGSPATDPVTVAECLLGTPYLWGGNSRTGIDCSGLVVMGHALCGRAAPGDSDLQRKGFGRLLDTGEPYQRGDLLFWPGHVAMVVDESRILHANSTFMCVMYEGIEAAMARIDGQGDGPFLCARRP